MTILLALILVISLCVNGILVWYTRKLIQNMYYGVKNVDEMQRMFEEYVSLLQPLAESENYYADPALGAAIFNTKLVIDACKVYKKTMIVSDNEEEQESTRQEEDSDQKEQAKREATISSVKA